MIDPGGQEYWSCMDYDKIEAMEFYSGWDAFCDAKGEINPQMPRSSATVTFIDKGEHTVVETVVKYDSLNQLEMVTQMGVKEGLTSSLNRLEKLLEQSK